MKKSVVVGSLNMDCVVETPSMPKPGETSTWKMCIRDRSFTVRISL